MSDYVETIVRRRWIIILGSILLTLCAGAGLSGLGFQNDFTIFFDDDDPRVAAYERIQETYAKRENLLIGLFPASADATDERTLTALAELTERAWQWPYVRRVDALTNYQYIRADGDEVTITALVPPGAESDPALRARARLVGLQEPLLRDRLLAADASATAINVNAQLPGLDKRAEVPAIVEAAEADLSILRARYPDIDFAMTGVLPMELEISRATRADIRSLMPLAGALAFLTLWLVLRSLSMAAAVMFIALCSVVAAMGATGWTGFALDPTTATAPTMILTLAIADAVHLLVSFRAALRSGLARTPAIAESVRANLQPVTLTTLTTVAGFLSLNASTSPPFAHLGSITAIGLLFAYLYSMVTLPALMAVMPVTNNRAGVDPAPRFARLARWVLAHRRSVLITTGLVCVLLIAQLPRNQIGDNFVTLFHPSTEFRQGTERITEEITGLYFLDYSLASGSGGRITEPAFLQSLQAFETWLHEQPEVVHVASIVPVFKRLNQAMHGDDADYHRIPDDAGAAAQYLLLYEMSLPYGLDLNDSINLDHTATRVTVSLRSIATDDILAFKARSEDWLARSSMRLDAEGTSPSVMFSFISRHNVESMATGTLLAFCLISLTLFFSLRSWRIGLISLVPNLIPAAVAFGLWGLFVGQVGLAVSVVAAMTLGIVVDDTIHFLSRYLRGRRDKRLSPAAAIEYVFSTTGPALVFTTAVLVVAFGTVATSMFQINTQMGLLAAITFIVALFADFLLLPTVLLLVDRDGAGDSMP